VRVRVFQHVPFEGLGALEPALRKRGCEIAATRFFANDPLPAAANVDFLIALGGPMSVNDEAAWPWLAAEKEFIRRHVAGGKPFLGICLGAQLLASALGAHVFPNRDKEIGWFPIAGVSARDPAVFRFPATAEVFQQARAEMVPGPFVQSETEILSAPPERYAALHGLQDALLDHLLAGPALRLP
jgi:GMP synthase-like glutamine amidotransferase